MSAEEKQPFYKKWWVWVIGVIIIIGAITGGGNKQGNDSGNTDANAVESTTESKPAAPKVGTNGVYMSNSTSIAAGYIFDEDGSVIYAAGGGGIEIKAKAKFTVNPETKEIEFGQWDEILAPKGNVTYTAEGESIVSFTNAKGVVFTFQKN